MKEPLISFNTEDIFELKESMLLTLKESARISSLKRARICLHRSEEEVVQEMILCVYRDSYVRPHRHNGKSESFHLIEGDLSVLLFDDQGNIFRRVELGASGGNKNLLYRLSVNAWHTILPRTDFVIFHEVTNGPFVRSETEYAKWSPHESEIDEVERYMKKIS